MSCPPQVTEKLKLAEKTAKEIEGLRDGYRPAARRGAVLFFVLSGMAAINSMYQYSLSSYLQVYTDIPVTLHDVILSLKLVRFLITR